MLTPSLVGRDPHFKYWTLSPKCTFPHLCFCSAVVKIMKKLQYSYKFVSQINCSNVETVLDWTIIIFLDSRVAICPFSRNSGQFARTFSHRCVKAFIGRRQVRDVTGLICRRVINETERRVVTLSLPREPKSLVEQVNVTNPRSYEK